MPGSPTPVRPYRESVWTHQDEQQFSEMQDRRVRVTKKRRATLRSALQSEVFPACAENPMGGPGDEILDLMILRAAAIRDALAPYDDGSRQASLADKVAVECEHACTHTSDSNLAGLLTQVCVACGATRTRDPLVGSGEYTRWMKKAAK